MLTWTQEISNPDEYIALRTLLTPSLRNLTLMVRRADEPGTLPTWQDDVLATILQSVFCTAIHLKKLVLGDVRHWTSLVRIETCRELQHFDLQLSSPITTSIAEVLITLTFLPNLSSLSMRRNRTYTYGTRGLSDLDTKPGFACLRKLVLCGHPEHILPLLMGASFPCLEHLQLYFEKEMRPGEMPSYIARVQLPRILPHLHKLYISESTFLMLRPDPPVDCSLLNLLGPFLALKELDTFEIRLGEHSPRVTDDEIRQVAESWSKIQVLRMAMFKPSHIWPSLHALNHIAQNCPDLRKLLLPPVRHRGDIPGTTLRRPHGLQELVTYGWEVDSRELKRYLNEVFAQVEIPLYGE